MDDYEKRETIHFLMRYRNATMNIESLTAEKLRVESSLHSITANMDGGNGGGSSTADKMGADVARLVDICNRISEEIIEYEKARKEVRRVIDRVWNKNEILGMDLHYRYIDFRTPFTTAHDLGYSTGYERKVHAQALAMAYKYM